eukprot:215261-Pelagomonas_calceolata.AAC.9
MGCSIWWSLIRGWLGSFKGRFHLLGGPSSESPFCKPSRAEHWFAWIECIGKAVLVPFLECVLELGCSLQGSVTLLVYQTCCAHTERACCRSWPRPDTRCAWETTSGDLMPRVSCGGRLWCWRM